ncbi:MAG: VOC family protein [Promethearchaeota archaeon]
MSNNMNLELKSLKIYQLGYVYKDIEKQAKIMESCFGVSKFNVFDPVDVNVNYRGVDKVIKMRAAFGRIFDTEIELLQPVEGDSIYTEFLNQGREGLHHICYQVDDLQPIINEYKEKGVEVLQSGKVITVSYAYMDTEKDFGIIVEYAAEKKRGKRKKG